MMEMFAHWTAGITKIAVGIFSSLMATVIFAEVIMRYGFGSSIFIADELSRLAFVWTGFLATSLGLRAGVHVSVGLIVDPLPARLRRPILFISQLSVFGFLMVILSAGIAVLPYQWDQLTPTMEIRMFWFYLPVPVAAGLMAIQILPQVKKTLRGDL
jgi:TRAP-type C4-dicarboxylate transport system permease small subunit